MRILIVTDAWFPQVNGVVRTWQATAEVLERRGHEVKFFSPSGRATFPLPFYPSIQVSLVTSRGIGREIDQLQPDAIHIATEGSLGWAARRACLVRGLPFTTSFHTRFAEYIAERLPLPRMASLIWAILRHFHSPSRGVMVPTPSIGRELTSRGFANIRNWSRGADTSVFHERRRDRFDLPRPILLFAGRIAGEKNIEAFLKVTVRGSKVVVGDGPDRLKLQAKYPDTLFTGYLFEEDYADALSSADVFVFPSRTDTFGLVMLEAMMCATPVAAFPVPSPIDVIEDGITGALDGDLSTAIARALTLDRQRVREASLFYSWDRTAELFESFIIPIAGVTTSPGRFHLQQAPPPLP
jgi:1,2-diacylglycerol 3-alpha-glucosyltransferase/glucuronosyltransferase